MPTSGEHTSPAVSVVTSILRLADPLAIRALQSILQQQIDGWELFVVHPGGVAEVPLVSGLAREPRVHFVDALALGGPSAGFNAALQRVASPIVALVPSLACLEPDALEVLVARFALEPLTDAIYTDSDVITAAGATTRTVRRPAWSPHLLRGHNYLDTLFAARTPVFRKVGGPREELAGLAEYDLLLRLAEMRPRVRHVREVLVHLPTPQAAAPMDPPSQAKLVSDHLGRLGLTASLEPGTRAWIPHRTYAAAPLHCKRNHPDARQQRKGQRGFQDLRLGGRQRAGRVKPRH